MTKNKSSLKCINPATQEVITTLPISSPLEISEKISSIKNAVGSWQSLRFRERGEYITRVRKELVSRMDEVIDVLCQETGKTHFDGVVEMFTTAEIMRFVANKGPGILKREKRRIGLLKTKRGFVQYLPYGIVGVISPWNYPLILTLGPVVQALMAGNGVILKPSEHTPLTSLKIKEIFDNAGFPKDLLKVVIGEAEVGQQIIDSEETKLICFIGSVDVGRKIANACADQLKPVILELGGKDSMIVLEDADIERAASAAVWGGMSNCGQTCISVERVYVEEGVADQFIEKVIELTKNIPIDREKGKNGIGSMAIKQQAEKVLSQIKEAKNSGADIPVGGKDAFSLGGYFIQPTVIVNAPHSTKVMTEETFGPVITITIVMNERDAVDSANKITYGLNASIFTRNVRKARELSKQLHAGNICINDVLVNYLCVELPFGGVGLSGMGRLQGKEGLRSFTQIQSACEDRFGFKKELWWFPISEQTKKGFKTFVKVFFG